MGTRETRLDRSRRQAEERVRALVGELVQARLVAGVSQRQLAAMLGCSQSEISRFERVAQPTSVTFADVYAIAAALGLEPSITLHPFGPALRDKGHQALIGRLRLLIGAAWKVAAEVPFPNAADPRSWDLLLRLPEQRAGVECETRIRDMQALVRRMHQRERDGGTDVVLLVLSRSAHNRRLVDELRESLGPRFATSPRRVAAALRNGEPLPGSAVLLV